MTSERIEVQRTIEADPAAIFAILRDPQGHVAIDSSGMLQSAEGEPVSGGRRQLRGAHGPRGAERLPGLGRYDVTVTISAFEPDREIAWTILGQIRPQIGHVYGYRLEPADGGTLVTSYYDWSNIDPKWRDAGIFPVISEGALRATLGILARTVARGGTAAARGAWPSPAWPRATAGRAVAATPRSRAAAARRPAARWPAAARHARAAEPARPRC